MSVLTEDLSTVGHRTAMMFVLAYTYKKDEEFVLSDFETIMKHHYPKAFIAYKSGGSRFGVFVQQMKAELYLVPVDKEIHKFRFTGFTAKNMQIFAHSGLSLDLLRPRHADIIPSDTTPPSLKKIVKKIVKKTEKQPRHAQKSTSVVELKSRLADLSSLVEKIVVDDKAKQIADKFPFLLTMPEDKIAKLKAVLSII